MTKILAHLKGLFAALLPIWTIYSAAMSDGAISDAEYGEIGKAVGFALGVWVIPNIGYVRRRIKGQTVTKEPEDADELGPGKGKHEFIDTDRDGISDAVELEANEPARRPVRRRSSHIEP